MNNITIIGSINEYYYYICLRITSIQMEKKVAEFYLLVPTYNGVRITDNEFVLVMSFRAAFK